MAEGEGLMGLERLTALAEELRATWLAQDGLEVRRADLTQSQRLYTVHPLAAHVHELAPTALSLFRNGHVLAAIPLVRVMYECALTAVWIQLRPDAANAFLNEDARGRRNTERRLQEAMSNVLRQGGVHGTDFEDLATAAREQARTFASRCGDISAGSDPYVYYGLMSWFVHPSVAVVDSYLDDRGARQHPILRRRPNDRPGGGRVHALLGVASMVWAGLAVDAFDSGHMRRSQLWQAARELGVSTAWRLTPAAETEVWQFEREQRHARRVGRRSMREGGSSDSG